jgi:hypothetical protein
MIQLDQGALEGRIGSRLTSTEGTDDEQTRLAVRADQVGQHVQTGGIGPVQVVQGDKQTALVGDSGHHVGHPAQQPPSSVLRGLILRRSGRYGHSRGELREETDQRLRV